ncbi:MAG: hypothetical protein ABI823_20895, partial [Bryobacteraceae bacterium]
MRPSIIISPDVDLARSLNAVLEELGQAGGARIVDSYPTASELSRLLRSHALEIIFINVESMEKSAEITSFVDQQVPGVQFIAIHRNADPQVLLETMRSGVREFLTAPFEKQLVAEAMTRAYEQLEKRPPEHKITDQVF